MLLYFSGTLQKLPPPNRLSPNALEGHGSPLLQHSLLWAAQLAVDCPSHVVSALGSHGPPSLQLLLLALATYPESCL